MAEKIEIDPSKSFRDLLTNEKLLAGLDRLGLKNPTPVQEETIPRALTGKDLLVKAKTGSGKTFAFALPLLSKLEDARAKGELKKNSTFGLIVSPTRELANQITKVVASLEFDVEPACLIGGESIGRQIKSLQNDQRLVVGTPGRILDLMRQGEVDLRNCRYLVLDEADEMLSMGFIDDIRAILSKLPKEKQGLFVSATISPYVESLANSFLREPERIDIASVGEELPQITHEYIEVGMGVSDKTAALIFALSKYDPKSVVVFCNTKSDTELVEVILKRRGYHAEKLNSDLSQRERDNVMSQMRSGELRILVATDIAARGLDIEHIELVVNYALPPEPAVYVHRTGRTGRAGRSGRAISLVGPQDFKPFFDLRKGMPQIALGKLEIQPIATA